MTDTRWINETASRYGKGGDPSIHVMMKRAIDAERERCASAVELADNTMMHQDKLAAHIRAGSLGM